MLLQLEAMSQLWDGRSSGNTMQIIALLPFWGLLEASGDFHEPVTWNGCRIDFVFSQNEDSISGRLI